MGPNADITGYACVRDSKAILHARYKKTPDQVNWLWRCGAQTTLMSEALQSQWPHGLWSIDGYDKHVTSGCIHIFFFFKLTVIWKCLLFSKFTLFLEMKTWWGGGTFLCFVFLFFFLDTCNSLLFGSWPIFSFNSVLIHFHTEQNQNDRNKSKAATLQQRQRHWKHLSTFPRGYVEVLTRHTHMVSRKLHRRLSSVHLTSTVCWLKKERKKDWLRASFTAQSQHWSVSFLEERIQTIIKKTNKKILKKNDV